jgi:fatty-acyl-CoA synthase
VPDGTEFNLWSVFETVAGAAGDAEAVVVGPRRLTYNQLAERARRLASYLHDRGLGVREERAGLAGWQSGQDHLALALYNSPEYLEGMLGGYRARLAPFNVNYRYVGAELRHLLGDAGPRALVFHSALAPVMAEVLADVPVEVVLQVADESGHDLVAGAVDYEEALAAGDPAGPPTEPSPDDLYILYTGGTTGLPKGVLWRQHDIFMAAMGGRRVGDWTELTSYEEIAARAGAAPGRVRVGILPPLMHGAAQWTAFYFMIDAATMVMPDDPRRLRPDDVWRSVAREGVIGFTVVGDSMLRPLLDELDRHPYDTSSLMVVGNGGAPLTPAVRQRLLDHLPQVLVTDTGGSSETGVQMQSVGSSERAPVFVPGPGTVVLDETLSALVEAGHSSPGWLAQSGYVPLGYLNDPEKTARTFPVVGGVRYSVPGDRARLLADGRIELLGRDSVTVNSGGEKIFVEEVEAALAGHPAVADVVVAGRPSERWGQEVVAVVELRPGSSASAEELVGFASDQIARYKLPKAVVFVPQVVRSPSGKADYRWAREQAAGT